MIRARILWVFFALAFVSSAESLEQQFLQAHNDVRSAVGVPPLRWSADLATYAADWAQTLANRGAFEHRPKNRYGENLYMIRGGPTNAAQVVRSWAEERKNYNARTNKCSGVCGHYTQLVWRNTTAVGCAMAPRGNRQIWVCNYDPPGNWRGQRPY